MTLTATQLRNPLASGTKIITTGLVRKQRKVISSLAKAEAKAQRDASKQTKTLASKMIREKLNLSKSQAERDLDVQMYGRNKWEFRAGYDPTPAHRFKGYRVPSRTARGKTRYLRVKFYKGKPAITFRKGFTILSGDTNVSIQRQGRARNPTEQILGPSPHSQIKGRRRELERHAKAAYKRRSRYWKDREIKRAVGL